MVKLQEREGKGWPWSFCWFWGCLCQQHVLRMAHLIFVWTMKLHDDPLFCCSWVYTQHTSHCSMISYHLDTNHYHDVIKSSWLSGESQSFLESGGVFLWVIERLWTSEGDTGEGMWYVGYQVSNTSWSPPGLEAEPWSSSGPRVPWIYLLYSRVGGWPSMYATSLYGSVLLGGSRLQSIGSLLIGSLNSKPYGTVLIMPCFLYYV